MSDTYQVCESCTHRFAVPIGARASKCETCAALDRKDAELTRLHAEAAELRAQLARVEVERDAACSRYQTLREGASVDSKLGDSLIRQRDAACADLASAKAEAEEYRLRLAGAMIASEGGNGCPDDAIKAIRTCPTIKSVMALRADLARVTGERDKEKARRVYYQDIVYDVCNTLDRAAKRSVSRGQGIVCGTIDEPHDNVQTGVKALVAERDAALAEVGRVREALTRTASGDARYDEEGPTERDKLIRNIESFAAAALTPPAPQQEKHTTHPEGDSR